MDPTRWFANLVGFDELDWDFDLNSIPSEVGELIGSFSTPTIAQLKQEVQKKEKRERGRQSAQFHVLWRNSWKNEDRFDTSAMQSNGPAGTMYQVASNFNCMEIPNAYTDVFNGRYLTHLMTDRTQGPSASGGAAPGAILRLAIHRKQRIDLLENTNLRHRNGKLYESNREVGSIDRIKIGLHKDVTALYDRSNRKCRMNQKRKKIDQVYTSTCICKDSKKTSKMAGDLLKAAYEGTYLAAAHRQTKRLVLTMIGGDCFGNNIGQIIDAITSAHKKYSKHLHPDCVVVLPLYSPGRYELAQRVADAIGNTAEVIEV